jgi:hypothetical protein
VWETPGPTLLNMRLSVFLVFSFFVWIGAGDSRAGFVPDLILKPEDVTVLMAGDGTNPNGLRPWIDDHRRLQIRNWPVGGKTTWTVTVPERGSYAVNVLFSHTVQIPLRVAVAAGDSRCEKLSEFIPRQAWRRLPLEGVLDLGPGQQTLTLSIGGAENGSEGTLELLSIELVQPEVQRRQKEAALRLRSEADTRWFREAGFGLMIHWTSGVTPRHGAPKPYEEAVRDFDLPLFVDQVARTGARVVTLTTSHARMFFPAPLRSLEAILPGRTSSRDLVGELAEALRARGIRLMLYYHLGSNADPKWQEASGFFKTDTREFWDHWSAVIGEAGERYGDRLAGWWFDDGTANYYYRSAPWERLARVAKTGHSGRLICFNPWVLPPATEFEDYLAGEGGGDPTLGGSLKPEDPGRISSGMYAGRQASAAIVMESVWDHVKRDSEISLPRWSPEKLGDLLGRFRALGNVPLLNCEIYQNGSLSPATVDLLHRISTDPKISTP